MSPDADDPTPSDNLMGEAQASAKTGDGDQAQETAADADQGLTDDASPDVVPDAPSDAGGERTVFMPPPEAQQPAPAHVAPDPQRTIVALPGEMSTGGAATGGAGSGYSAQPPETGRVAVGAVLNHIYEVKRFIARGGMGEVYEGANVNSDERVAIKVMLPHLAADPKVQAMFRKEARTLTRLQHPALVQYRVLAQEPGLGVFYIVTEYIDGAPLADLIGELKPTASELSALTRRLAEGLAVAHELGAIHRDIAPDNVLLPDRNLAGAKVIDFGIAKDLDPSNATIVGDGFAGKLGYVAPEQFGDYDRQVGAWTDIYSLALVILSLAAGRQIDMGATLVDAIDKRRKGPDLSPLPDSLRPVFARMLEPDPALRLRSMEAVIAALDAVPSTDDVSGSQVSDAGKTQTRAAAAPSGSRKGLLIGGGALALAAVLAGAAYLVLKPGDAAPPAQVSVAKAPDAEIARRAIEAALPNISCSWLDLDAARGGPAGVSVDLSGVAGATSEAQGAVGRAIQTSGVPLAEVDMSHVAPVGREVCDPLDAFRSVRAETSKAGRRLTTPQRTFELSPQADRDNKVFGRAVIGMNLGDPTLNFALLGLEPTGKIDPILSDRAQIEALVKAGNSAIVVMGPNHWRLSIDNDHTGWSGLLLVTAKGSIDTTLLAGPRGPDWRQRFEAAARAGDWKTEMVWYRVVDEIPN